MPTTLFFMAKMEKKENPENHKSNPNPMANPKPTPKNQTQPKSNPNTRANPKPTTQSQSQKKASPKPMAQAIQNSSDDELLVVTEEMEKMSRLAKAQEARERVEIKRLMAVKPQQQEIDSDEELLAATLQLEQV